MKEYENDRRAPQHWHVEKKISITHIFTTMTVILAIIAGYYDLRDTDKYNISKTEALAVEFKHTRELQAQIDKSQDERSSAILTEIIDAKQEFRDQHTQTRRELKDEQRETRQLLNTIVNSVTKTNEKKL